MCEDIYNLIILSLFTLFQTTCWGLEWVETSRSCIIFTSDEINNTVNRSGSVLVKVGPFCIWSKYVITTSNQPKNIYLSL